MSNNKLQSKNGFTLIELIIAMSIILIITLAFFNVVNTSIKFNTKNEKDIKALHIAQSEIENIRSQIKNVKDDETSEFRTLDGKEISLNTNTEYEKAIDGNRNTYSVNLILSKEGSLYTIKINVKSNQSSFSKRSVYLVTQVYGK